MEAIAGYSMGSLPVRGLEWKADLIEHDGPILSHFSNGSEDYLFYWVDYDEDCNRWLVWKISDEQLYYYLRGDVSLNTLLLETNKDFVFTVDIDRDFNHTNIMAFGLDEIPAVYVPQSELAFQFEVPGIYAELLHKYNDRISYLQILKERALTFKLVPSSRKYESTVSTEDAGTFLKKLTNSFLAFVEVNFYESFKGTIGDYKKMNQLISQFRDALNPRIVYLNYGSFEVGISVDTKQIVGQQYSTWQSGILDLYEKDVVDVDYDSEQELQAISAKYDLNARKQIYSPIIEILNDKDYRVNVTNFKKTINRSYKQVSKNRQSIILPKVVIVDSEVEKKKHLLSFVIEVTEGEDVQKISKTQIQTGLLFAQEVQEARIPLPEVQFGSYTIKFKSNIEYTYHFVNNIPTAEYSYLGISVTGEDKNSTTTAFMQKLGEVCYMAITEPHSLENELVSRVEQIVDTIS